MAPSQVVNLAAKSDEDLVQEARESFVRAESAERDASAWKWEVADRIVVLRERGWTFKRIAEAVGFSNQSAQNYYRAATIMIDGKRPASFYEAQLAIGRQKPREEMSDLTTRQVLRNAPIKQVAEILSNLPAERLNEISREVAATASAEVSEALVEGSSDGAFPRRLAEVEDARNAAIERARERGDTGLEQRLDDLEADHERERLARAARYARAAEHALAGLVRTLKAGEHDDDAHGEILRERMQRMRLLLDMTSALLETGEIDWDAAFEQVLVAAEEDGS